MVDPINFTEAAIKYMKAGFEYRKNKFGEDTGRKFLKAILDEADSLLAGKSVGRRANDGSGLFMRNVPDTHYYIVYKFTSYGIQVVSIRSHRQEPE